MKLFQQKSQNCIFCVHKTPWKKFDLLKNVDFFSFFRTLSWEKNELSRILCKGCHNGISCVQAMFWGKTILLKKIQICHLFGLRAEGSFHLSRRLRVRSVQRALTVSWGTLEEKQFFRRTHKIFDRFRTLGKKLGIWLNFTRRVVKTAIDSFDSSELKNYVLIHLFRVFSRKKMTLAKLHQADCQNCILCGNETLRGKINLLKKRYVLFIFFRTSTGEKIRV